MATIRAALGAPLDMFETYISSAYHPELSLVTASEATLRFPTDASDILSGSNFSTNEDGEVQSGTITGVVEFVEGRPSFQIEDISLELNDLISLFDNGDYGSFFQHIMSTNDLVFGSNLNDNISTYEGNDVIVSGSGVDVVDGGAGIDLVIVDELLTSTHLSLDSTGTIVHYGNNSLELYDIEYIQFNDVKSKVSELVMIADQYQALASRVASGSELDFWVKAIADGASINDVKAAVIAYDFTNADQQHINKLYIDFSGRLPSHEESVYWSTQLAAGTSLSAVKVAIVDDPIGQQFTSDFVSSVYNDYSGRASTIYEQKYWLDAIRNSNIKYQDIRRAVIADDIGQTFAVKSISSIYENFLGRVATNSEIQYWAGNVHDNGISYKDVRRSVINDSVGHAYVSLRVDELYSKIFARSATSDEHSYWQDLVSSGMEFDIIKTVLENDSSAKISAPDTEFSTVELSHSSLHSAVNSSLIPSPTSVDNTYIHESSFLLPLNTIDDVNNIYRENMYVFSYIGAQSSVLSNTLYA